MQRPGSKTNASSCVTGQKNARKELPAADEGRGVHPSVHLLSACFVLGLGTQALAHMEPSLWPCWRPGVGGSGVIAVPLVWPPFHIASAPSLLPVSLSLCLCPVSPFLHLCLGSSPEHVSPHLSLPVSPSPSHLPPSGPLCKCVAESHSPHYLLAPGAPTDAEPLCCCHHGQL